MAHIDTLVNEHYGFGQLREKIVAGLSQAGKSIDALTVDDLAPIDQFHTRGREATLEVASLADLKSSDCILDVGCGLGGTARHLAEVYGCQVVGIDLTNEYVDVGQELTERVGLSDRVQLYQASALDIPFEENRFDVVWTEHVQMNIADKQRFYAEITRVLKPSGHLLFHDVFRGPRDSPIYPVPWAETEPLSFLATEADARATMEEVGLEIDQWIGKVSESQTFFQTVLVKIMAGGPPPLGIHLLMGDNALDKLHNYVRNITGQRVTVAMGMAHKRHPV